MESQLYGFQIQTGIGWPGQCVSKLLSVCAQVYKHTLDLLSDQHFKVCMSQGKYFDPLVVF